MLCESNLFYQAVFIEIFEQSHAIRVHFKMRLGAVPDFANPANAIRRRRVSEVGDEALCLVSVLQLDTKRIVESEQDDAEVRMRRFWQVMPAFR